MRYLGIFDGYFRQLHCPNASAVAAFKAALRRGDIFLHGFPHDGEAS